MLFFVFLTDAFICAHIFNTDVMFACLTCWAREVN